MKKYNSFLFVLVIISLIVFILAGCNSKAPKEVIIAPTIIPIINETIPIPEPVFSVELCNFLSAEDIQKILSLNEIIFKAEPNGLEIQNSKCNKIFTGWNLDNSSGPTITYAIIDAFYESNANNYIGDLCKDNQTLNLGDYKSCERESVINFGKGKNMIAIMCNGCEKEKVKELAKLIEQRI